MSNRRFHTRFQDFFKRIPTFVERIELGKFCAPSPKAVTIYSNRPCVARLHNKYTLDKSPKSPGLVHRATDSDGITKVWGLPALKDSQAYPIEFGRAIAGVYLETLGKYNVATPKRCYL